MVLAFFIYFGIPSTFGINFSAEISGILTLSLNVAAYVAENVRGGIAAIMVFQHFNLFPHLTVLENITLAPVELGKLSQEEAEGLAIGLLAEVGLADKSLAYPKSISGGQKQRVAIAREVGDRVIFMDGGYVVEEGHPDDVFDSFQEERTQDFLSKVR